VHQDLEALLALQADDDVIEGLDGKLRALGPRISELERRRKAIADNLAAAEAHGLIEILDNVPAS